GGEFTTAGGVPANAIAKWNGTQWSALGSGMGLWGGGPDVYALTVFDDGTGPALYAGGRFTTAGGVTANWIAKWNGTQWSALGSGMNTLVYALTVFDDGTGPALYAGGGFTTAGGVAANRIAKWDGTQWSALGSGMQGYVQALTVFDDGTGPALYAAGTTAGGVHSYGIARWGCQTSPTDSDGDLVPNESDNCPEHYNPSQADCDGDGMGDACEPDCNTNSIPDDCDIDQGTSQDCTGNGIPDECEPDCNSNGVADSCDIDQGTSQDCTGNGTPDECETDCNGNGLADSCDVDLGGSQDCNANGIPDECDVASGASEDCQPNSVPDDCEWLAYATRHGQERTAGRDVVARCQSPDQQAHGGALIVPLDAELRAAATDGFTFATATTITGLSWWGTYRDACGEPCTPTDDFIVSFYVNEDGLANKLVRTYHLGGTVQRTLTGKTIPFEVGFSEYAYSTELAPPLHVEPGKVYWVEMRNPVGFPCVWWWETAPPTGFGNGLALYDADENGYGAEDAASYDLAFCVSGLPAAQDCNTNGVDDAQDILVGTSLDCQTNGIPDECEPDRNFNGVPDDCDIVAGISKDKNFNGVPDEADCPTRPGDLDGDCDVDLDDYAAFSVCLGKTGAELLGSCPCADLDLSGTVEVVDYLGFATSADTLDEACRIRPPDACPDSWATNLSGRDETFYDFGVHGPIPAGFFGEGSDPFGGLVSLIGTPADPNDVHGETDTQIQHGPVVFNSNGTAEVVLEITALELQAREPIVVSYDGGRATEEWLMVAGLSPRYPGPGVLTAQLDGPGANSGTFDATVYVQPVFVFVKVQDLLDGVLPECVTMRVLDTGEPLGGRAAMPPITLGFTDQPFVRTADPEIVGQLSVPDCAQGNFVPGIRETRGRDGTRTQELTCESHVTEGEAHYFCPPECKGSDVCRYVASGPVIPLAGCTNVPLFPQAMLGGDCPGGLDCTGNAIKYKPCPGGGFAARVYSYLACVKRNSICQGACCGEHGGCVLSTYALCEGLYTGADSCSPDPCPPTGACCYDDGACDEVLAYTCDATGGDHQGDGTTCDPSPCPRSAEFVEDAAQSYGFDAHTRPGSPYKSAEVAASDTATLNIVPPTAASSIYLTSFDTGKVTVAPAVAGGSPQTVTMTGVATGSSDIDARVGSSSGQKLATMTTAAYNERTKTVAIILVHEQNDDVQVIPVDQGQPNAVAITAGTNGILDTTTNGDDRVSGVTITSGEDGVCDTPRVGDDVQVIPVGFGAPDVLCVIKGANNFRDTVGHGGDDLVNADDDITTGTDGICDTTANSTDVLSTDVGTAADVGIYLNETVYNQAVFAWTVTKLAAVTVNFDLNRDGQIDTSSWMTAEMQAVRDAAKDDAYDHNIFLVDNGSYPGGFGYMEFSQPYGFVHVNQSPAPNTTIAHELGHGGFGLIHDSGLGVQENLMTQGPQVKWRLFKGQWDTINP
ncbi:MAG: hypothetical protein V2A79_05255, partial [Planctomycetota bacterium]